ncbi:MULTISPECIES: SDR family NAD(P)-dependent oxidoreductase [unclassified Streptomyces]|uniref:SDR family NAD(P)-dependent oxidoreductase n=1 Tax=unclassified Streptomyces TaxID=2593676 RepID=UPI0034342761
MFLDQFKDGGGDLVNVSSVAGRPGRQRRQRRVRGPKFGLNGWSEALRKELLPDVRVTMIEPGVVATELPTQAGGRSRCGDRQRPPVRGLPTPRALARGECGDRPQPDVRQ